MSNLAVVTFDNVDEAGQVREALRELEHEQLISLNDSAVVVKDADGKVHVQNQMDRGVKVGAVGGGLLGLLIGSIFLPFAGVLGGALVGAAIGKVVDMGVDQKFVQDVTNALTPGTSALFVIVRQANPAAVRGALQPFKGEVYQTTLSSEAEESLRDVLHKRT